MYMSHSLYAPAHKPCKENEKFGYIHCRLTKLPVQYYHLTDALKLKYTQDVYTPAADDVVVQHNAVVIHATTTRQWNSCTSCVHAHVRANRGKYLYTGLNVNQ